MICAQGTYSVIIRTQIMAHYNDFVQLAEVLNGFKDFPLAATVGRVWRIGMCV